MMIYTILLYLIQPLIWIYLWYRGRKVPTYRKRWAERYGFCSGKVGAGGILLHAVSVGETLSAVPLVQALQYHYPNLPITISSITPTGSECVQSVFGKDIYHVYLPYDLPDAICRFLHSVDPKLVIIMETELWPNLIKALHTRKVPLVIVNARLSAHSEKGYKKLGKFMYQLLQNVTLIAAQHKKDGTRFIKLGLKHSKLVITGSLKFDISVSPELNARSVALRRQWAMFRPVWIAASTHEGEENIILEAYSFLLSYIPNLLLILAPRHPERFESVCDIVKKNGYTYVLRSSGEVPVSSIQVIVVDTIGELMLLYGIADLAFIGGSLTVHGGHNPLEPAAHAIPILMGPHTFNFEDICKKLKKSNGLITVIDAVSLAQEIRNLLLNNDYRYYCGRQAISVLYQNQGALKKTLALLEPYLLQQGY